jgi:hypothetical protein
MNKQKLPKGIEWWTTMTPELAYVLGFIYADGHVREGHNDVALVQKDRQILDLLFPIMQGENKRIIPHGRGGWALKLHLNGLRDILASYGIVPRKTYHGQFPLNIPENLVVHYIRGFFDGDGYILERRSNSKARRWIVGFTCYVKAYTESVVTELINRGLSDALIYESRNNWKVKWHGREDIQKLSEILYESASLFLPRKKFIFVEALSYYQNNPRWSTTLRLSYDQAQEIKQIYSLGGYSFVQLGKMFGVGRTTIESIVKGRVKSYE